MPRTALLRLSGAMLKSVASSPEPEPASGII